ncbi:hypothetical protein B0O99DRAFT_746270 [Bisporella sp. PMI_857]|nr:hypothetical protein B0O99DRAFT_746270 [Bisporella sp. PMI_857]
MVHGSWFTVIGFTALVHGSRFMVHGSWFMVDDFMVHGSRFHGSWSTVHGPRFMVRKGVSRIDGHPLARRAIYQFSMPTMAPTETTDPQSTSPNHLSSEQPKPSKADDTPGDAHPETTQNQSTDPATVELLQHTVRSTDELTDPAIEEILRGAT